MAAGPSSRQIGDYVVKSVMQPATMCALARADWSNFARSERPAPYAGMNTHDSAATSMNKINALMRTALSEFQGIAVPFKTMRTPVHFANKI
jgi:hypothetical protein